MVLEKDSYREKTDIIAPKKRVTIVHFVAPIEVTKTQIVQ